MIRHLPVILITCSILALGTAPGFASDDDQINSALTTAKAWISQIDAGHYDDSYLVAGSALHEKVSQDNWVEVLKTFRPAWGNVISRKTVSHTYKPDGYDGRSGEFMIITYDTSFKNLDGEVEVVVLQKESGQWRGVGYFTRSKVKQQQDESQQDSQTDVQSQTVPVNQ